MNDGDNDLHYIFVKKLFILFPCDFLHYIILCYTLFHAWEKAM